MRLLVGTEAHLYRAPDGAHYSDTGARAYEFWARYLDAFESVRVLARVSTRATPGAGRVEGPSISVVPLPGFRGLRGYMRSRVSLGRVIGRAVRESDQAYLARIPGLVGGLLIAEVSRRERQYGVEVVGQATTGLHLPGAPGDLVRRVADDWMRRQCSGAVAAAYVTRYDLQARYPPGRLASVSHYSSVELSDEAFVSLPRPTRRRTLPQLVTVGAHKPHKGHDVLIEAVRLLRDRALPVSVRFVGGGDQEPALRRKARILGVSGLVTFSGVVASGNDVRKALDDADLFVLPSRAEGLPRALIEAMARGLPAVASDVGGCRELLAEADLVPAGSASLLATAVQTMLDDPERMSRTAVQNLSRSREYAESVLTSRRRRFYDELLRASNPRLCPVQEAR